MKSQWLAPLLLLALPQAGCKSTGNYTPTPSPTVETVRVEPGSEASLFPLQVGDQWTYDFNESEGNRPTGDPVEFQVRVVKSERVGSGTQGTIEILEDDTVQDRQVWLVDDTGLYQLSAGSQNKETGKVRDVSFLPMQTIAKFPLKEGDTFTWSGQGVMPSGEEGKMTEQAAVKPAENVDTTLGVLNAVPIESRTAFQGKTFGGTSIATVYLRPKIGMVRFRMEIRNVIPDPDPTKPPSVRIVTQLLKLKSHTLKTS